MGKKGTKIEEGAHAERKKICPYFVNKNRLNDYAIYFVDSI